MEKLVQVAINFLMNKNKNKFVRSNILILMFFLLLGLFGGNSNAQNKHQVLFRVPLSEIAKRLEYQYVFDNMIYDLSTRGNFLELDLLPTGDNIRVAIYIIEGNKILFLPIETMNREVYLNGVSTGMYYSDQSKGYLFYILNEWETDEVMIPANSFEDGFYGKITETIVMEENISEVLYLGEIELTFNPEKKLDLPPIDVEENEYIDAVLRSIRKTLTEKQEYGTYNIHIETYGRVHQEHGVSKAKITGVVVGEETEQYFQFEIPDMGGNIVWAYTKDVLPPDETSLYFVSKDTLKKKPPDLVSRVIGLGREVIPLEITIETENMAEENISAYETVNERYVNFSKMSANEAAEWVGDICSYIEYFGLNELGSRNCEVSDYEEKELIMYLWENRSDSLLFLPKEKINCIVIGNNEEKYPLNMDKDGNLRFYRIDNNPYADIMGQLSTTLPFREIILGDSSKKLIKLGEAKLNIPAHPGQSVQSIDEEDEYVQSLAKHVKEFLGQTGINGKYKMYIGELEGMGSQLITSPSVCISAAVIGEKEYYFRYMVVKSQTDQYYFWPIGFGLNGSLEECEGEKHYMNRLCIERTKQLNRCEIDIDI